LTIDEHINQNQTIKKFTQLEFEQNVVDVSSR